MQQYKTLHNACTVHASELLTYISFDTEFQWYKSISDGQRSDESSEWDLQNGIAKWTAYQQLFCLIL